MAAFLVLTVETVDRTDCYYELNESRVDRRIQQLKQRGCDPIDVSLCGRAYRPVSGYQIDLPVVWE